MKGNDKAQIDARIQALSRAAQKLGEKMYANTQAQQAAGSTSQAREAEAAQNDDVVDADFKEVKR